MPISKEFAIQKQKNIQIAVTVAPKETSNKALLSLVTSIDSFKMKNYVKKKKAGCVACIKEKDGLRNTRFKAMALTQIIALGDDVGLYTKKLLHLSSSFPQHEGLPSPKLHVPSYAHKM